MAEKIVLIDGHSILNRAFYGIPDLTNSEGLHTNAVYGFLNIMLKIIDEEQPDYLTVAFDLHHPTFRHEMFSEYKGTRKPMPQELREQVPLIQEVLTAMGVRLVMKAGYEADDILGTIARRAEARGMEVSLVSGDRDLLQLATDKILIRIPKTSRGGTKVEDYHTQEVVDKYGITPLQIIDLKGLMGDTADNIPGVAGVGEKTAVKVLSAFPSVEEVYEHLEEITPKRTHDLLEKGREQAFLSKKLATIKTDCELEYELSEAKLPELFNEQSFQLIKRLEFKSLLKRFDAGQVRDMLPELMVREIADQKALEDFMTEMYACSPQIVGLGFLGENWTSQGAKNKQLIKKKTSAKNVQMSFVFDEAGQDVHIDTGEEKEYSFYGLSVSYQKQSKNITGCLLVGEELTGAYLVGKLREMVERLPGLALSGWKDVLHMTDAEAFPDRTAQERKKLFQRLADVQIGAYLLDPLKNTYLTDDIARDYLELTIASYEESFGKRTIAEVVESASKQKEMTGERALLMQYLGYLSYVPCMAWPVIRDRLEAEEMQQLFETVEMPTAYYLYQMEKAGVRADRKVLTELSKKLGTRETELEQEIYDMAGETFNINSPKQLGVILFEKLKLPFAKKTKTGYSTAADILEKLRPEDPIIDKILEYRQVTKLRSTYADGLPVYIEQDGRIHGKFNQTITATGRISSTDPNLQNIPIRMELGRQLRKVFIPKDGYVFLDADYSQIELRVLAHMSGDPALIEAYRESLDIHTSTASKVFQVPFDEVTPLQRRNAKAVNFGIIYGISSFGLGQDIHVSRKEAEHFISQYFETYPKIKEYLEGLVSSAKSSGHTTTLYGRRRPVPELSSGNYMQRSFGERIAMNAPIQGTAADIIKIAMIRVSERLLQEGLSSRVVLQVHDELLVETLEAEVEQVKQILLEEMTAAAELKVPLVAEVEQGRDWYEAH